MTTQLQQQVELVAAVLHGTIEETCRRLGVTVEAGNQVLQDLKSASNCYQDKIAKMVASQEVDEWATPGPEDLLPPELPHFPFASLRTTHTTRV